MPNRTAAILLCTFALTAWTATAIDAGETRCDSDVDSCIKYMVQNFENKGWIGIELEYEEGESPRITRVLGDSPAAAAGLAVGDVLVALDGVAYATATEDQLRQAKKVMVPGHEVELSIERGGEQRAVPLTLGSIPQSVLAQWIGAHLLEGHGHQFQTAEAD